jgi:hypothetical protein
MFQSQTGMFPGWFYSKKGSKIDFKRDEKREVTRE